MAFNIVFLGLFLLLTSYIECLHLKNKAYEDLTIKISEDVPVDNCKQILENLQTSLQSASQFLFSALDGKAFLRSATVSLPTSWPDTCAPTAVTSGSGETSDITVLPRNPTRGALWTQQSLGCGQPGDQIYLSFDRLLVPDNKLGRSLVKEFAMYRYGVFEEQGYYNDPIYPLCYMDDDKKEGRLSGCSDLHINDHGICRGENVSAYNASSMVDPNARSSIIFAPEAPSVSMFCDSGNHDRIAPTKQNLICDRRSILDVILNHNDFKSDNSSSSELTSHQIADTTPKISFKKQKLTRYVFVVENTKDMMQRESWYYMKLALSLWAVNRLPNNTELALVLTELKSTVACELFPTNPTNAHKFHSSIPYTPSDSIKPGCLTCGLKDAMNMLNQRNNLKGPANNIIVIISPGMDKNSQMESLLKEIKKSNIKIASINYPHIIRSNSLNILAEATGGSAYTVFEQKLNVDSTLLTTYFELLSVLSDITRRYYSGRQSDLPMEIHRREIIDDGRSSVTGSFVLDPNMGEPATFNFFTHNTATPLFKSLKLISPSHQIYTSRNDRLLLLKNIVLDANITESGTWTYTVETYPGNPQPHFLQVYATPKSPIAPILSAKFWTHKIQQNGPLILLTEVKIGEMPVLGAKVEVTVTKTCNPCNQTHDRSNQPYKFDLLDTGSGDPDITKGDGVYTRYFSASEGGIGFYTFEVKVTDNGNTAYRWAESSKISDKPCCGSNIPSSGAEPISPFQRNLPKQTVYISSQDILTSSQFPAGKIGDLKVQIIAEDMKARLIWTAPDMGGNSVSRYEIKYSYSVKDIIDNFEINGIRWDEGLGPLPLSPGSETTFNLDFSQTKELLDKPMYFAVKAFSKMSSDVPGTISNWVRVLVPSPPPPPTVAPTYTHNEQYWPNSNSVDIDHISPSISKTMNFGLELILPIAIGFILLVVLLILYCYFCVVKRRERQIVKKSPSKSTKNDKLNGNITIVPSSPLNSASQTYNSDIPEHHTVGVPVSNFGYEDETKKRYSLVNQQEQQLIEELKQQQQQINREASYGGVSVITNRNGHPLSPFNSWTASQLLHEHERRHSPLENMPEEQLNHDMMMNGSQIDHLSMNGQSIDQLNLNGHHLSPQMVEQYQQTHMAPPVPPLPAFNGNGYPPNYTIYGTHQPQNHQLYQTIRNEPIGPFNPSLQGSMSSVNSGEKKRRNVTMV
ncbi:hypothetical protein HHI36_016093 [Cryptolaemus montrouzieri]|uniref:Calcium-activated chloride channel N-terminal domain-containing protein n=1 Tax=Cryptolaemus montrouzieri TaxID=559131 RepID=A0ABD2N7R7_9CUCU